MKVIDELRIMPLVIDLNHYWNWGVRVMALSCDSEVILDRALLGLEVNRDLGRIEIDILFFKLYISKVKRGGSR